MTTVAKTCIRIFQELTSLEERIGTTKILIQEVMDQIGIDKDDPEWEEQQLDKDEEDEDLSEKGWIIVSPNPPSMKGVDHYFLDEDETEMEADWTARSLDAMIFASKVAANQKKKFLERTKNTHFKNNKLKVMYFSRLKGDE